MTKLLIKALKMLNPGARVMVLIGREKTERNYNKGGSYIKDNKK